VTIYDCIVIGAGPGGLAMSFYLQQHGLRYLTLEKGEVGQSWKDMSACFRLLSPMWTNVLPGDRLGLSCLRHMTCNQYGTYLQHYAARQQLHIQTHTLVHHVETTERFLHLYTDRGIFMTKSLVTAAGYFSNPYQPDVAVAPTPDCLVIHAAQYHSVEQMRQHHVQSALIVGKRNTAGQLLADLHNAGIRVSLSMRNTLTFRDNSSIKGRLKEFLYFFWEAVFIRRHPNLRLDSFPPMDSKDAKDIIESGAVRLYPNIQCISGKTVLFDDESSATFDAVIFATGYRPTLQHLRDFIPPETPLSYETAFTLEKQRIFFVGLDNLYNYRSRYIRGIRNDARIVVAKVKEAIQGALLVSAEVEDPA
jgi:putative flavoprotein involved in K+ transport